MTKFEVKQLEKVADHVEKEVYMKAGNGAIRLELTLKFRDKQIELYTDYMERKQFHEIRFEHIYSYVDEWNCEEVIES